MTMITLELPFPPSVNTYWRRVNGKTLISAKGRAYANQVAWMTRRSARFPAGIRAAVLVDDSVIDDLRIIRKCVVKGGKVVVSIKEMSC